MPTEVDFDIEGMTCTACANRIERKLNKLPGVSASVNYATERARVALPSTLTQADVQATVSAAGYRATPITHGADSEAAAEQSLAAMKRRLLISTGLSVPVVLLAMIPAWQFPGWQWLSLALATPIATWCAWPFHRAAALNARHLTTTMDTLVSLGVLAAYGWSVAALLFGTAGHIGMTHGFDLRVQPGDGLGNIYFEAAAGVTTFLLAGRYFEKRAKTQSSAALRALADLGAKQVRVVSDGVTRTIEIDQLQVGDVFIAGPGEQIATDGQVVVGQAGVNESMITGESQPVAIGVGDQVTGATIVLDGQLQIRATQVGAETVLGQLTRLVEDAQTGKANVQRLADKISGIFVPIVLLAAVATLLFWLLNDASTAFAIGAAVAVLIVACPCALGLATPTALMVGTGRGAQLGILMKGPEALEATDRLDVVVLDKTGTLTTGQMTVVDEAYADGADPDEVRTLAAAAESASEHPVARAITATVASSAEPERFITFAGQGVLATINGREVMVGNTALLVAQGHEVPRTLQSAFDRAQANGHTAVWVAWEGEAQGVLSVADRVKTSAAGTIAAFRELGIEPMIASGDHQQVVDNVASALSITRASGGLSPAGKVALIAELQSQGLKVAMVGDGINDAAALAQADLGLAIGAGTDVARAASDLTLMGDGLDRAVTAVRLARRTLSTIKANLFWAFAYNVAAIPLAAAGLLNPMLAGGAMALSSVFVVTNSLRLRGFHA